MRLYRNFWILAFIGFIFALASVVMYFDDIGSNSRITGYDIVNTKVEVYPVVFRNCSFDLYPGWNMVSFYCLGMYAERDKVLESIGDDYGSIFKYQANDADDPWKSYNSSIPTWAIQQLSRLDRTSGYWIFIYNRTAPQICANNTNLSNMTNCTNVSTTGITFDYPGIYSDSTIYLYDGWNLIGYPNTQSANISDFFINDSYHIAKYYNTSTDTWLIYINGSVNNTLEKFETYKGYWVNVSGDHEWHIHR